MPASGAGIEDNEMAMMEHYDLICMLCGTLVGEVEAGRFRHHQGCASRPTMRGGSLRCCRCGGSTYQERSDQLNLSAKAAAISAEFEAKLRAAS